MRRSRLVVAAVTLALVTVVVAVRGGTAADEVALAVEPGPAASPGATSVVERQDDDRLSANGLPGLRLGTRPVASDVLGGPVDNGCVLLGSSVYTDEWGVSGWAVDDRVASVVLSAYTPEPSVQRLSTWLGPTLGSPIQAAQELPRARTVTERPFSRDGPEVSVVTVPLQGVEVVFANPPVTSFPESWDEVTVPITSIEVRTPRARQCAPADVYAQLGWAEPSSQGVVVDLDGTGPLRLGASADDLVTTEGVVTEVTDGVMSDGSSCRSFSLLTPGSWVRAAAVDGVVTEVQVSGRGFATTFGLPAEADLDDVVARFPEHEGRSAESLASGVTVLVDDVTVELQLQPDLAWVPDLETPVSGGDLRLSGVVLRAPETMAYPC